MQARGKVINKLALVLLSMIVLELVLIGDQVQPVKAIKKKIYLKKLKKILPLLALVKPKKKLILVPIPIPMFKKEPFRNYVPPSQHMTVGKPMGMAGSNEAMSFMMVEPNMNIAAAGPIEPSQMMTMPSMTMTIQSDGSGTMSAIELTPGASNAYNSTAAPSGALIAAGRPSKWHEQQHYDFQTDEQFSLNEFLQPIKQRPREGDHYYASPWANSIMTQPASRPPLVSPAKFVRNGRLKQQLSSWTSSSSRKPTESKLQQSKETSEPIRQQQQQQTIALITTSSQPTQQTQLKHKQSMPIVTIKSQWRHAGVTQQPNGPATATTTAATTAAAQPDETPVSERLRAQQLAGPKLSKQQEQQIASALEQESLIQVGPTRLIPIYQSPNGRISMTPPPVMMHHASSMNHAESANSDEQNVAELNAEVRLNEPNRNQFRQPHDHSFEHDNSAPSGEMMPKSNRFSNERSKRPEGVKRASGGTLASAY